MRRTYVIIAAALILTPACALGPSDDGSKPDPASKTVMPQVAQPPEEIEAAPVPAVADETRTLPLKHEPGCRAVSGLLHAQRFTLSEPHAYKWMEGHPDITDGTIVVLEVDPKCAKPRQDAMPVLFAGDVPVEIAVDGYPSGRLVAFIPGHVDLTKTPIYYGAPELPERVDAARGAAELTAAGQAGIGPFSLEIVEKAVEQGGSDLHLAGTTELYGAAEELASH